MRRDELVGEIARIQNNRKPKPKPVPWWRRLLRRIKRAFS